MTAEVFADAVYWIAMINPKDHWHSRAVSAKATIDGVVLAPSAFGMTFGCAPSITATQELVVPRSMPMTLLM